MKILILYASLEGQTKKIAEYIAENLSNQNQEIKLASAKNMTEDLVLESFDGIMIGASVHMGSHPKFLKKLIKQHIDLLNEKPTAFFSVCMAVKNRLPEKQQEARQYLEDFIHQTGWEPIAQQTFAGAIKYSKYGFFVRLVMKQIAKKEGADTDTSRDYEYTDWDAVTEFANGFLLILEKNMSQ